MSRQPLNEMQVGFIGLVLRSRDDGEGWRKVSKTIWPVVAKVNVPAEILEVRPEGDAGFVRLTEAGQIVVKYV
jgi:hypothetical protein